MFQVSRCFFGFAVGVATSLLLVDGAWAETWSDSTGKFQIEAEFVGVEGKSVVLRKPDGSTINVPIERLSAESRAQAKRLYEMAKSGGGVSPSDPAPSASAAKSLSPPTGKLNFPPPVPVKIPPMPAFPEDVSLQETVDFVRDQVLSGHPEVFWHALPDDVRSAIDSSELREKMIPYFQEQAKTNQPIEEVVMKAVEVLITKKQFVLNSPMMGQVPPPMMKMVGEGYDPAVGLIYEIFLFGFNSKAIESMTVTEMVDHHGPRIGGHLQALAKLAPPEMIEQFSSQIVVEQTDDSSGTITVPKQEGGTETTEMVKYLGRWVPKALADGWEANQDTLADQMVALLKAAEQDPQAKQQANFMVGMVVGMADSALDPLLAAKTQQEFDQAVMQVMAVAGTLGGGGQGGGPGAAPIGDPGGPEGF